MAFKLNTEHIQSMPVQISLVLLSFICLALCLYKPIIQFQPIDNKPTLQIPTAQEVHNSVCIKTGMSITDFLKFDAIKNDYSINAIIWFVYNPAQITQESIDNFSFTKGDVLKKSDAKISNLPDGNTMAQYHVRVQFTTIPNYKRFPLDDHYLYLNVTNDTLNGEKVIFEVDAADYTLSPNLYAPGWAIAEHEARAGYAITHLSSTQTIKQPKVVFSIGLSKQDYRQLLLIILPLLLIFYFGIFAFSIKDIALAITLILASVSGLIAYSFVIQTLSPAVGYLMLSDYMFLLFLGIIFTIFFVTALNATPEHIVSRKTVEMIKGISIIVIYAALIGLWFYLTHMKDL